MKPPFILALDIGTSSVRAALYDADGEALPETMVKNERAVVVTEAGGAELNAETAFRQVKKALGDVLKKCPVEIQEIEYTATSCFWHSLVGVDEEGMATTPVYTWAETRPAKYIDVLRDELNESEVHNRTGARFHSSFWTAKLLWLRKEQREVFKKTAQWLSFSDFVGLKLFGSSATSVSMASATGIFNIRQNEWDKELIKFLKIKLENLPEIIAPEFNTFQLKPKYQKRWKRLKNAKWFPAIGDGAANNIGAGCVKKEKAALMIGTSAALRVAYEGEVPGRIPRGLWCYRIDRKRIIIGGALSDGGGLYRWLKNNFRLNEDDDETEDKIAERIPDGHGLTFLPFLAGERSTGYHENARGAILGLKLARDEIDIVQAALEAVAFRLAEILDQLKTVVKAREIIASGGALRESPVWTQIIADVLAQNLSLPDTREASSRGAVLLALETIGKINSIAEIKTPVGREFYFNKKRHEIYKKARRRHEKYYALLIN